MQGEIRIVDVIAGGASEEKEIYCRNFRKFFRGIAALFSGTKKRRLQTELPEAVISLAGFPRESTANKYSYLRSSRTLEKRGTRVAKHRYFVFFRSPPSLDVNRVGRVLSEYTSHHFFVFLSSFLDSPLFGRNRA